MAADGPKVKWRGKENFLNFPNWISVRAARNGFSKAPKMLQMIWRISYQDSPYYRPESLLITSACRACHQPRRTEHILYLFNDFGPE